MSAVTVIISGRSLTAGKALTSAGLEQLIACVHSTLSLYFLSRRVFGQMPDRTSVNSVKLAQG
jgi:hypothetical protein